MLDTVRVTKIKNGYTVSFFEEEYSDEFVYYCSDLAQVNNLLYKIFLLEKDDSKAGVVNS